MESTDLSKFPFRPGLPVPAAVQRAQAKIMELTEFKLSDDDHMDMIEIDSQLSSQSQVDLIGGGGPPPPPRAVADNSLRRKSDDRCPLSLTVRITILGPGQLEKFKRKSLAQTVACSNGNGEEIKSRTATGTVHTVENSQNTGISNPESIKIQENQNSAQAQPPVVTIEDKDDEEAVTGVTVTFPTAINLNKSERETETPASTSALITRAPDPVKPIEFPSVKTIFWKAMQALSHLGRFGCNICHKRFRTNDHLKRHLGYCSAHKIFKCSICEQTFIFESYLQEHMLTHTRGQGHPFECYDCTESFILEQQLLDHKAIHLKEKNKISRKIKTYDCDICGQVFMGDSKLRRHSKIHVAGAKVPKAKTFFECNICSTRFRLPESLIAHKNREHSATPQNLATVGTEENVDPTLQKKKLESSVACECEICGKVFFQDQNLKRHQRTIHFQEKKFECQVCGKKMRRKCTFEAHKRVHDGILTHECKSCGVGFNHVNGLTHHVCNKIPNSQKQMTDNNSTTWTPAAVNPLEVETTTNYPAHEPIPEQVNPEIPPQKEPIVIDLCDSDSDF